MRASTMLFAVLASAGIGGATAARPLAAQETTEKKVFVLPHVLEVVGQAIDQSMPRGLTPAEQASYTAQTEWLTSVRTRMDDLGVKHGVIAPRDAATGMPTGKRQHKPHMFTSEWSVLQAQIERESRKFNTLSNASKARHDIAMNAIRNLKG